MVLKRRSILSWLVQTEALSLIESQCMLMSYISVKCLEGQQSLDTFAAFLPADCECASRHPVAIRWACADVLCWGRLLRGDFDWAGAAA